MTFTGPVLGGSQSGNENYQFVNNATAPVTIKGPMSAFPGGTNTSVSSTLRFLGTGETIVEGNITDSPDTNNPAPPNMTTGVSKEGPGRLVLKGTNNYKGVTFLTGGFLCLESPSALGSGRLRIGQAGAFPRYDGFYTVLELGSGWTNGFTMPFGTGNGQLEFGGIAGQADGSAGFAAVSGTINVNIGGGVLCIWGGLGGGRFFFNAGPGAGPNPTYQAAFILGSPYCNGTLNFQNPIELYDRTRTIIALDGGAEVDGRISGVISSYTNAAAGIIKEGNGTLELAAANLYTGPTIIEAGRLLVSGSLSSGSTVTVKPGATLGGTGTIGGPVIVAGGTLSPGVSIGTLTINNSLTFSNNSQMLVEINAANGTRDQVVGLSSVAYAGTLVVTTNHAGVVTNGQSFQIFSVSGSKTGNFANIINQVPGVTAWTFNPSTGVLTASVPTVPTTPTNITYSVSGNSLTLSWPANYIGWQLESNSVSITSSGDWYPVAGSTATNQVIISIDPTKTNVFYRLKY
ncbi:MAG: autotransporter-associated beta strand repeat-containing protein [Verrucomicrobiae bacterium]|nr:autotransporter-associated beta strand repeat-containing protein [Verrucomicrobiae bacterium]